MTSKLSADRILTVAEIETQYRSEWVLVEDPETDESCEVLSGKVRYHSKDRDEVYREAVRLRPKRFAMLYTGTMPKDTAIVLGTLGKFETEKIKALTEF